MLTVVTTLMTSFMMSIIEFLVVWSTRHLKVFIIFIFFIMEIVFESSWWSKSLMMWSFFLLSILLFWPLMVEWLSEWLELRVTFMSLWFFVHWWHLVNWCSLVVKLLSHLLNGVSGIFSGIVELNIIILLVNVLVNHVVHEVLGVDNANESK
jgi:hypothetical protein